MPELTVTKADWWRVVELVRKKSGVETPVWIALSNYYNICVESVADPLSKSIFELWCRLRGTQNESYESLMNLPAIYVAGCDCIAAEINRVKAVTNG